MEARKVAAQFVAFTLYLNQQKQGRPRLDDAGRFARGNWQCFLPYASEELARFLMKRPAAAGTVPRRRRRKTGHHLAVVA